MTIGDLSGVLFGAETYGHQPVIQICHKPIIGDFDWNSYDSVAANSALIADIKDYKITELSAINEDIVRVQIDWNPTKESRKSLQEENASSDRI